MSQRVCIVVEHPHSVTCQHRQLLLYPKFSVFYNYGQAVISPPTGAGIPYQSNQIIGISCNSEVEGQRNQICSNTTHFPWKGQHKAHPRNTPFASNLEPYTKQPRPSQQRDNSFDQRGWRALESRISLFQSRYSCVDNRVKYMLDSFWYTRMLVYYHNKTFCITQPCSDA